MRRLVILAASPVAALVLVAGPAAAATPYSVVQHDQFPKDLAKQTCDEGTTQGTEVCQAQKLKSLDHQIDLTAAAIRKRSFSADSRARVDKAQKAWFAFRDADCSSASDVFEGGTLAGVIYGGCQLDDSRARLKELKSQLKDRQANS